MFDVLLSSTSELTFFPSLPIIPFFSSHVNVLPMHKRAKQSLIDSKARRHTNRTHNCCSCKSFRRWRRFKKSSKRILLAGGRSLHLRGKVSVNTASSRLTSVLIVTPSALLAAPLLIHHFGILCSYWNCSSCSRASSWAGPHSSGVMMFPS